MCFWLQSSTLGITKRDIRASQTASDSKEAATPAPSGQTWQRLHEVASHTILNGGRTACRPMALTVHL